MSLVGSLEDLGLGDILQIISMSRKSGVLFLQTDEGEGRIVFRDGQVHGAVVKSGPADLRSLLLTTGTLSDAQYEAAVRESRAQGVGVEKLLAQRFELGAERLEVLRRSAAERAVLQMFLWQSGEFGFEARDDVESRGDTGLLLASGLSAQFLAIEGTRLRDEASRARASAEPAAASGAAERAGARAEEAPVPRAEEPQHLVARAAQAAVEAEDARAATAPERPAGSPPPPLVVVDRELAALEWARGALRGVFPRIHVFQRSELGIARVRQYLARVETPLVLLSTNAPADPLTGARDAAEILERLKSQSPRMRVVLWAEAGETFVPRGAVPDARLERPSRRELVDRRAAKELAARLPALQSTLLGALGSAPRGAERGPSAPALPEPERRRFEEARARLHACGSGDDVLRELVAFAAESFSRVAIFTLEAEVAAGAAAHGLARAGGPEEGALRGLRVPLGGSGWFEAAIARGAPLRAAPGGEADRRLALALGACAPVQAFVAPVLCAGRALALLYADELPGDGPLPDSAALEALLPEAGAALGRLAAAAAS